MKPGNAGGGKGPWFKATQEVAKDKEIGLWSWMEPPESVRKLQMALQAKAKGAPSYRFYLLYDKLYRKDVLQYAYDRCKANQGAPGVDRQDFADIAAYGEDRWLGELAEKLHRRTSRGSPTGVDSEGEGQEASSARDSDVGGIEHLMQFALGMMDGDGPSWRPILGDVDPIRY